MTIAVPDPEPDRSAGTEIFDSQAEALIVETRARIERDAERRERWSTAVFGLGFLATGLSVAVLLPQDRHPAALIFALYVLGYAAVSRVEFEIGTGAAIPTQLVLVPMLFVLPLRFVPLCVAAALVLRTPKDLFRGRRTMNEFFVRLLSSWHAIGPVLVFVAAHAVRPRWGEWPVVAGALAAQFVFDYATSTGREWLALGTPRWSRLGSWAGCTWWTVRSRRSHLRSPLSMSFIRGRSRWFSRLWRCFAVFARERRSRIDHALELGEAYRGTAFLLGDVVEADDAYTGSHSRDVVSLAVAIADRLELGARERRQTELVALLHDVGKIRVPPEIINKPGPLTTEERAVINQHTILGEQMLDRVGGLLRDVGRLVRSCHEH